jgi:hypothetical protein
LRLDDGAVPGLAVDPIDRGQPGESGSRAGAFLQRSRGALVCLALGLFAAGTQVRSALGDVMYLGDQHPAGGGATGDVVQRFLPATGALITTAPNPWVSGYQVEGIDVLKFTGATPVTEVFVADFTNSKIYVYNAATAAPIGGTKADPGMLFTGLGTNSVASIRVSTDGRTVYAMGEKGGDGTGAAFAINSQTGALIKQVAITGAHDVVVLGDGSVLIAAYSTGTGEVFHYSANLATKLGDFIIAGGNLTNGVANEHGLASPTGMVVDHNGNVWISDINDAIVNEYDKNGNFIHSVAMGAGSRPVGLDVGPDGNIYVATLGFGTVMEIMNGGLTPYAISTFIGNPLAGNNPKYPRFDVNAVTVAPFVPEPSSLVLASMGILGLGVLFRRRGRKVRIAS